MATGKLTKGSSLTPPGTQPLPTRRSTKRKNPHHHGQSEHLLMARAGLRRVKRAMTNPEWCIRNGQEFRGPPAELERAKKRIEDARKKELHPMTPHLKARAS